MKKDLLYEFGYDELAERVINKFDDAIIGIVTDGCNYGIGYDESKIPCDELELIPEDDYIIELADEDYVLKKYEGAVIFGPRGENEYPGSIIGTTGNHILYDYDLIAECKMKQNSEPVTIDGNTIGPMTYEDAVEDIEYNIIRAMPYYPEGPRILMDREMFEEE